MPHWNETNDLLYWNMYSATQKNQGQPRQRLEVMCWPALPYIEILEEVVHLLSPDLMAQKFLRFHLFWTLLILMQSKQTETDKKRYFSGKDNLRIQWNTITKTNLFPVFNTCGCVWMCVPYGPDQFLIGLQLTWVSELLKLCKWFCTNKVEND